MLAFAVCGGWNLLRSGGGSEAVKSTELMDFVAVPADGKGGVGGEGGATKEKDGEGKQCPVSVYVCLCHTPGGVCVIHSPVGMR